MKATISLKWRPTQNNSGCWAAVLTNQRVIVPSFHQCHLICKFSTWPWPPISPVVLKAMCWPARVLLHLGSFFPWLWNSIKLTFNCLNEVENRCLSHFQSSSFIISAKSIRATTVDNLLYSFPSYQRITPPIPTSLIAEIGDIILDAHVWMWL